MARMKRSQGSDSVKHSQTECSYALTEQGTDKYADLSTAQAAALPVVAQALAAAILEDLAEGRLTVVTENGQRIVRVPSEECE